MRAELLNASAGLVGFEVRFSVAVWTLRGSTVGTEGFFLFRPLLPGRGTSG